MRTFLWFFGLPAAALAALFFWSQSDVKPVKPTAPFAATSSASSLTPSAGAVPAATRIAPAQPMEPLEEHEPYTGESGCPKGMTFIPGIYHGWLCVSPIVSGLRNDNTMSTADWDATCRITPKKIRGNDDCEGAEFKALLLRDKEQSTLSVRKRTD